MRRIIAITAVAIIAVLIISFSVMDHQYHNKDQDNLEILDGSLSLSGWNELPTKLEGEWRFYPGIGYEELSQMDEYLLRRVPHEWHNDMAMEQSPYGMGVYTLTVDDLEPGRIYGFQILDQVTAFNLFFNGELLASNGNVKEKVANWQPTAGAFQTDDSGRVEIAIEVSNAEYYRGGYWNALQIGDLSAVLADRTMAQFGDIFLFSSILVIGIFFLGMSGKYRHKRVLLYFSLFCLNMSMRILLTGQRMIHTIIHGLEWDLLVRLEYIHGYLLLPLFGLFMLSVLARKQQQNLERVLMLLAIAAVILPTTTSHAFYALILEPYKYAGFVMAGLLMVGFVNALRHREKSAVYMLIACLVIVVCVIKEIYFPNEISFLPIGTLIVVISFALMTIDEFVIISRKNEILESEILHDKLTGLYNRQFIMEHLQNNMEQSVGPDKFLLFLDLDGFKVINDSHGHHIGDIILKEASRRLKSIIRGSDIIARIGGDEFLVYIENDAPKNVQSIAGRIIDYLNEDIVFEGQSYNIGVSIGVCQYQEGWSVKEWIEKSDRLMYVSKRAGGNRYTEHQPQCLADLG